MNKYYFLENKNVLGPYTSTELAEKKISINSLICKAGTNEWKNISDYPELDNIKQALPPALPKEIRNKRKIAHFIIETYQKLFSKNALVLLSLFLVLGLLTGLTYFYIISDGSKNYSKFIEVSEYITSNPEQIQKEDNYVNSLTGWEGAKVRNGTYHEAQNFYKKQYETALEKAKYYTLYSFLTVIISSILFFIIKNGVNWVKNNS